MKRTEVIKRLRRAAKEAGVEYRETELTRHTGISIGHVSSTLKRHTEIDEITVGKFFKQFSDVLGEGWWR
jgi:hypothetical protein